MTAAEFHVDVINLIMRLISTAHSFSRKILPNSADQLTKSAAHCGKIVQIPVFHLWLKTESCSETSVIEGWHCTTGQHEVRISLRSYASSILKVQW